jgi:hypothetical protein
MSTKLNGKPSGSAENQRRSRLLSLKHSNTVKAMTTEYTDKILTPKYQLIEPICLLATLLDLTTELFQYNTKNLRAEHSQ